MASDISNLFSSAEVREFKRLLGGNEPSVSTIDTEYIPTTSKIEANVITLKVTYEKHIVTSRNVLRAYVVTTYTSHNTTFDRYTQYTAINDVSYTITNGEVYINLQSIVIPIFKSDKDSISGIPTFKFYIDVI